MTWEHPPLVGDSRARALAGRSAGGTLLVLGGRTAEAPGEAGAGPFGPDALAGAYDLSGGRVHGAPAAALEETARIASLSADEPLVLVADDLEVSPVALLDVLDAPGDSTYTAVVDGAVVADRSGAPTAVRLSATGRRVVSVGTDWHLVTRPTAYAVGVLRVRGTDRAALGAALAAASADLRSLAAAGRVGEEPGATADVAPLDVAPFDLALLAAVRAGVPVRAVTLAHQTVRRGSWHVDGAPGSPWQQRLRAASRGNDGVFSTLAIRPLSRRLTAYGLRRDWSPNVVTAVSLVLGLAACAAVATGVWWAWVLAAVLLQASLVVDCVDGEIARFTRRYSPLGGWLDAVSDRVKEFTMVAALAWVAARDGSDLWWLAVLVLALLAMRHVEDHAYTTRRLAQVEGAVGWPEEPLRVGILERGDGGPEGERTTLPPPPDARGRRVRDVKQVLHLPIAERYLIMSVGLLTLRPAVVLWALGLASLVAFSWTQVGRLLRAFTGRDGFRSDRPDPRLAGLCDLAVVPRPTGRGRLAWQVPVVLIAVETAALLLAAGADTNARAAAYAWLVVVCWHVYDNVYRLRETGTGAATWLRRTTGVEVRVVVLALVGGAIAQPAVPLLVGAVLLGVLYAAESTAAWRATLASVPGRT